MKITITLAGEWASLLSEMTRDRNEVLRAYGYESVGTKDEIAATILEDGIPEKAEFWRREANLLRQAGRAV